MMQIAGDILVIDDEPAIVQFITETLEEEGYAVRSADDQASACERVGERRPDLILADLHLGGADTAALVRYFACIGQLGVPVVVMTTDPQLAEATSLDGIAFCLVKPFDLDVLIDCVASHIRRNATAA
jgi:DNA-binding response OmpR family regulator